MKFLVLFSSLICLALGNVVPQIPAVEQISEIQKNSEFFSDKETMDLTHIGSINGKLYYLETTNTTHAGAANECANFGFSLAEFSSIDELNYIANRTILNGCWTSGKLLNQPSSFEWTSNGEIMSSTLAMSQLSEYALGVMLWIPTDNSDPFLVPTRNTELRCSICFISQSTARNNSFHLGNSGRRTEKIQALSIERKKVGSVAEVQDVTFIGSTNGKSYYLGSDKTDFAGANNACANYGLMLAEFTTQAEMDNVGALLPPGINYCWTSGKLLNRPSSFQWTSSGTTIPSTLPMGSYSQYVLGVLLFKVNGIDSAYLLPTTNVETRNYICFLRTST